jgi:hypothetical protein
MIMKMVEAYGLNNDIHMLYFAELINTGYSPQCRKLPELSPGKTIFDLDGIIKSGNFCINTRIVKYILNYSFDGFCVFIENQPSDFVEQLYNMALGNGYHTIEAYEQNLNFIKKQLLESSPLERQVRLNFFTLAPKSALKEGI